MTENFLKLANDNFNCVKLDSSDPDSKDFIAKYNAPVGIIVIDDEEEEVGRYTWNPNKSDKVMEALNAIVNLEGLEAATEEDDEEKIDLAAALELAEAYLKIEQFDMSIITLEGISDNEGLEKDAKLKVRSRYLLGKAHLRNGAFNDSKTAFEEVGKIDDKGTLGYGFLMQYEYGIALIQVREFVEAYQAFKLFIEKNANHENAPRAFLNLGATLYYQDKKAEAVKIWRDFGNKYPGHNLVKNATTYADQVAKDIEKEEEPEPRDAEEESPEDDESDEKEEPSEESDSEDGIGK